MSKNQQGMGPISRAAARARAKKAAAAAAPKVTRRFAVALDLEVGCPAGYTADEIRAAIDRCVMGALDTSLEDELSESGCSLEHSFCSEVRDRGEVKP